MRFQRGQSIVEFALVLPLFLLFTFSIIYFGCVFADYVTLGTIARSSARTAVVLQQEDAAKQQDDYQKIREGFNDQKLPLISMNGILVINTILIFSIKAQQILLQMAM